jgi:hypothetical protein
MTFSTPFSGDVVFCSAFKANLKEKPSLLGYLFFSSICNWHLQSCKRRADFKFSFYIVQVSADNCGDCNEVTAVHSITPVTILDM